jgi:glucose/arabinose dehydrogenase
MNMTSLVSPAVLALMLASNASCAPKVRLEEPHVRGQTSTVQGFRVETVVSGLRIPWKILWTPDGRMLFTERPGRVRVFQHGHLDPQPLFTVSDINARSEAGLMGMCLHPAYSQNKLIYLSYSYRGNEGEGVKVVRYRDGGTTLTQDKVIISGIPGVLLHAGCCIKFGPDGKLYITTGEAGHGALAQDLGSLGGKVLRLNDDGSIPSDNPFVGRSGAKPEIWTYGNRNPQGMDWQPGTNTLFETEHGPSNFDAPGGGDEVNIIRRGENYGWPTIHHRQTHAGMVSPLLEYTPAVAPASATFYTGDKLPQFKNNFFFGCLVGQGVVRVVLNGSNVVSQEEMLTDYGRIRAVAQGPDGYFYFSTSNRDGRGEPAEDDDRILRLVPK